MQLHQHYITLARLCLFSFSLAAITGFAFRYAGFGSIPFGFTAQNLRHAHSHLMFFNWLTVGLCLVIVLRSYSKLADAIQLRFVHSLYTMLALGFITYPLFLLFGYKPVFLFGRNLPLAAMASGIVMLGWYYFIWLCWIYRSQVKTNLFFNCALVALVFSSLAAWIIAGFQVERFFNPYLSSLFTHYFLTLFTEGWAGLMVAGILYCNCPNKKADAEPYWSIMLIFIGSLMIFPLAMSKSDLTTGLYWLSFAGQTFLISGWTYIVWLLLGSSYKYSLLQRIVLTLLIIKIILLLINYLPFEIWPGEHGLRVFYVHMMLLGASSICLIDELFASQQQIKTVFMATVVFVLLSLALISGYWPSIIQTDYRAQLVLISAFLPVIPTVVLLFRKKMWLKNMREL